MVDLSLWHAFSWPPPRNDRFITYVGSSYWGDARYVVTLDKSRINIHAPDRILVYVRSQVPSGTVTSALIRGSGSPSGRPAPAMPPGVIYPVDPSAGSSAGSSADKAAMYLAHYQRLEQNVKEAFLRETFLWKKDLLPREGVCQEQPS